jgi:hypothetical protein
MAVHTTVQGTKTATILNLGTLAAATYITSTAIDLGAKQPLDVLIEVAADPNGTPTGNMQLVVFAKGSLDNTNYSSGPESGTAATNEADLAFIGVLPCNDTTEHRKLFSLASAFGGVLPRYVKIVCRNDMGVALTSGNVFRADVTGDST